MNILPIVFAFIFIFSFLTLGFIQQQNHSILSEKSLKSFHAISRLASNAVAQRHYKRIKTAPTTPNSAQQPSASPPAAAAPRKAYRSQREIFPPLESSKLNLLPLLELKTEPKNHPLYEICAELLRLLYDEPLFKQSKKEGIEYDLLNAMLKIYRTKSAIKTLSDLYPDAPDLKPIFYKMLKGTNQYNVHTQRGIAPLEDFFIFDKKASIHFSFSSFPLLQAIFGKKTALKILSEEKKKYEEGGKKASLTQDELTALLSNDPAHSSLVLELGEQIDFSQKYTKRSNLGKRDKARGLSVKKRI